MRHILMALPFLLPWVGCGKGEEIQTPAKTGPQTAAKPVQAAQLKPGAVYHFGTNKRWTNIMFDTRTSLGSLSGSTRQIGGSASVGEDGKSGSCSFVVKADLVTTGQDGIDTVMRREEKWLNTGEFPTIEFKADEATLVSAREWKVKGDFTLKGIAKKLEFKADVLPIPASIVETLKMGEGDWVRVKTRFQLKLSDYGIVVPETTARISDIVNISIDVFGSTKKPGTSESSDIFTQPLIKPTDPDYTKLEAVEGKLYRFNVKSQLTSIRVESKSAMEALVARNCIMAGKAKMDLEQGTGRILLSVPAGCLFTDLKEVNDALYGKGLLDVAQHRDIFFESTSLKRREGDSWALEGVLKILGRDVKIVTDAEVRYIPTAEVRKNRWGARDGVRFFATLNFKLSDLGMTVPAALAGRVADEVTLIFEAIAIR